MDRIKLVSIDVDGCLVAYQNIGSKFESSWDALGYAYGLKEIWDKRIIEFFGKKDDYEWAKMDVADLKGKRVKEAENSLYPLPYAKGAKDFAKISKGKLIRGLLTTAIDLVAEKAVEELELEFAFCNILHRNNGYFTGTLDYRVPLWTKHEKIEEICEKFKIKRGEICHVGDHENDIAVGEKVGLFVAFNPKTKNTEKAAKYVINDFQELGKILSL